MEINNIDISVYNICIEALKYAESSNQWKAVQIMLTYYQLYIKTNKSSFKSKLIDQIDVVNITFYRTSVSNTKRKTSPIKSNRSLKSQKGYGKYQSSSSSYHSFRSSDDSVETVQKRNDIIQKKFLEIQLKTAFLNERTKLLEQLKEANKNLKNTNERLENLENLKKSMKKKKGDTNINNYNINIFSNINFLNGWNSIFNLGWFKAPVQNGRDYLQQRLDTGMASVSSFKNWLFSLPFVAGAYAMKWTKSFISSILSLSPMIILPVATVLGVGCALWYIGPTLYYHYFENIQEIVGLVGENSVKVSSEIMNITNNNSNITNIIENVLVEGKNVLMLTDGSEFKQLVVLPYNVSIGVSGKIVGTATKTFVNVILGHMTKIFNSFANIGFADLPTVALSILITGYPTL